MEPTPGSISEDNRYYRPLFLAGLAMERRGDRAGAMAAYRKSLEIAPDAPEPLTNLANLLTEEDRLEEALPLYRRARDAAPAIPDVHLNLAKTCRDLNRPQESAGEYLEALRIDSRLALAWNGLGELALAEGRCEEAVGYFENATECAPGSAEIGNRLGCALLAAGRHKKAADSFRRALGLDPSFAEAAANLSKAYRDMGDLNRSIKWYDRVIARDPENPAFRFNRAATLLLAGDYKHGWEEFEWRFTLSAIKQSSAMPTASIPAWDGFPAAGKTLLIFAEQGLGDTIHFARYLPMLYRFGFQRILLHCPTPLHRLMAGVPGIEIQTDEPLPGTADFQIQIMSLARIFRTGLGTIPAQVPYLPVDEQLRLDWAQKLTGPGPKIGLVWAGNPDHRNDRHRSVSLKTLASAAASWPGRLFSLQKGKAAEAIGASGLSNRLVDLGRELTDLADTAAAVQNLDLVISVDTAAAHLAGALAAPVWVLLPFSPDWRWLLGRSDSPWYPTMRLFRQPAPGRWEPVMEALSNALAKEIGR